MNKPLYINVKSDNIQISEKWGRFRTVSITNLVCTRPEGYQYQQNCFIPQYLLLYQYIVHSITIDQHIVRHMTNQRSTKYVKKHVRSNVDCYWNYGTNLVKVHWWLGTKERQLRGLTSVVPICNEHPLCKIFEEQWLCFWILAHCVYCRGNLVDPMFNSWEFATETFRYLIQGI